MTTLRDKLRLAALTRTPADLTPGETLAVFATLEAALLARDSPSTHAEPYAAALRLYEGK